MLCSVEQRAAAQSLERGNSGMDLSTKFGKEIPSFLSLREKKVSLHGHLGELLPCHTCENRSGCMRNKDQKSFKTADFSKKSVVLVKRKNGFTKTVPWTENPGKNKEKSVLVNSFLRFAKTTEIFFLLKFSVLRARVPK